MLGLAPFGLAGSRRTVFRCGAAAAPQGAQGIGRPNRPWIPSRTSPSPPSSRSPPPLPSSSPNASSPAARSPAPPAGTPAPSSSTSPSSPSPSPSASSGPSPSATPPSSPSPTWGAPAAEGFAAWFVGTFVYYWWHRLRHQPGWWTVFHQIHHSPARIEILTSFYKHPLEILTNAALSAFLLYPVLGCSLLGAFWYNFFAATGEYFYHANLRSPRWLRLFIQTPELHSIHHQQDVHAYNYSDLPLWDRLFGTYRDAPDFAPRCGFHGDAEQKLGSMLLFQDVNADTSA